MFFNLSLALSGILAFAIGFFTRRFWTIIFSLILSAGIGFGATLLYINFDLPAEVGLGVIALFPALVILNVSFNLGSAFLAGLIGTFIGKRRKRI